MKIRSSSPPVVFGEVLFDRFPDGAVVLGGAPFNVAWNLHALGLAPLLVSRVGTDELGDEILSAMDDWGLDRSGVQVDPGHPTGTVEVTVEDGEPSFEIAPEKAYDFIAEEELPECGADFLLYHGSLALRTETPRRALTRLLGMGTAGVLMDVNLRDPHWNGAHVSELMAGATWVKLNENELETLVPAEADPGRRARWLLDRLPLDSVIVTRGEKGSLVRGREDEAHDPAPVSAPRIVDTVGAGDAFSSIVILGLVRKWAWPLILTRAQAFAAAVVGLRGATTRDRSFYQNFVDQWEHA